MNQDNNNEFNNCINDNKIISKKGKVMMFVALISIIFIYFNKSITSMNWYDRLVAEAFLNHDDQLRLALDTIENLIYIVNCTIVLIITILSSVFLIIDKKKKHSVRIYEWYIVAGLFYFELNGIGLMMYPISTFIFSIKNKNSNKAKNINVKSDSVLIIFSSILSISIIISFIISFIKNMILSSRL